MPGATAASVACLDLLTRDDGAAYRRLFALGGRLRDGIAALAVALPWPLLLVLVDERTEDPLLLGLVGAARLLPYVAVSWATARLADERQGGLAQHPGGLAGGTAGVWLGVAVAMLVVGGAADMVSSAFRNAMLMEQDGVVRPASMH